MHKPLTVAVGITLVAAVTVVVSQTGIFGSSALKGDIAGGTVYCCNETTYTCEPRSVSDAIGQCFSNSYGDLAQCMTSCVQPPCPPGWWRNPASHACEQTVVAPPPDPGCPPGMHRDATNPAACMPDMTAPPPADPGCPAGMYRDPASQACMPNPVVPNPADTDCVNRGGIVTPNGCSCPPPLTWNETGTACIPVGPIAPPAPAPCPEGFEFDLTGTICLPIQDCGNNLLNLGEQCGVYRTCIFRDILGNRKVTNNDFKRCDTSKNLLCSDISNGPGPYFCQQASRVTQRCPNYAGDTASGASDACTCDEVMCTNQANGAKTCLSLKGLPRSVSFPTIKSAVLYLNLMTVSEANTCNFSEPNGRELFLP